VSLEQQRPRAAPRPTVTVAVQGSVRTASGQPVAGARAFLSGTPHSSVTDREGQFAMLDVPVGRYRLSFTHPRFDTLGVVGPVVDVHATTSLEQHLTMPHDDDIARSACGVAPADSSAPAPALLYGYVRDGASPAVIAKATVTLTRRLPSARGPTVGVRNEAMEVETDATGYYQICGVPRDVPLTVRATRETRRSAEHRVEPIGSAVTRLDLELPR
jgi:hypothetical protein